MSAPIEERNGYLAGYLGCALYDAGKTSLREVRWSILEKTISERYANGSESLSTPVGALAVKLGTLQPPPVPDSAAERYTEKYGFFDGEYWRQSSEDLRLGFVEGYIECWQSEKIGGAQYSRPPKEYVVEISRWYRVRDDDDTAIDRQRSDAKIPAVLRRFRDRR